MSADTNVRNYRYDHMQVRLQPAFAKHAVHGPDRFAPQSEGLRPQGDNFVAHSEATARHFHLSESGEFSLHLYKLLLRGTLVDLVNPVESLPGRMHQLDQIREAFDVDEEVHFETVREAIEDNFFMRDMVFMRLKILRASVKFGLRPVDFEETSAYEDWREKEAADLQAWLRANEKAPGYNAWMRLTLRSAENVEALLGSALWSGQKFYVAAWLTGLQEKANGVYGPQGQYRASCGVQGGGKHMLVEFPDTEMTFFCLDETAQLRLELRQGTVDKEEAEGIARGNLHSVDDTKLGRIAFDMINLGCCLRELELQLHRKSKIRFVKNAVKGGIVTRRMVTQNPVTGEIADAEGYRQVGKLRCIIQCISEFRKKAGEPVDPTKLHIWLYTPSIRPLLSQSMRQRVGDPLTRFRKAVQRVMVARRTNKLQGLEPPETVTGPRLQRLGDVQGVATVYKHVMEDVTARGWDSDIIDDTMRRRINGNSHEHIDEIRRRSLLLNMRSSETGARRKGAFGMWNTLTQDVAGGVWADDHDYDDDDDPKFRATLSDDPLEGLEVPKKDVTIELYQHAMAMVWDLWELGTLKNFGDESQMPDPVPVRLRNYNFTDVKRIANGEMLPPWQILRPVLQIGSTWGIRATLQRILLMLRLLHSWEKRGRPRMADLHAIKALWPAVIGAAASGLLSRDEIKLNMYLSGRMLLLSRKVLERHYEILNITQAREMMSLVLWLVGTALRLEAGAQAPMELVWPHLRHAATSKVRELLDSRATTASEHVGVEQALSAAKAQLEADMAVRGAFPQGFKLQVFTAFERYDLITKHIKKYLEQHLGRANVDVKIMDKMEEALNALHKTMITAKVGVRVAEGEQPPVDTIPLYDISKTLQPAREEMIRRLKDSLSGAAVRINMENARWEPYTAETDYDDVVVHMYQLLVNYTEACIKYLLKGTETNIRAQAATMVVSVKDTLRVFISSIQTQISAKLARQILPQERVMELLTPPLESREMGRTASGASRRSRSPSPDSDIPPAAVEAGRRWKRNTSLGSDSHANGGGGDDHEPLNILPDFEMCVMLNSIMEIAIKQRELEHIMEVGLHKRLMEAEADLDEDARRPQMQRHMADSNEDSDSVSEVDTGSTSSSDEAPEGLNWLGNANGEDYDELDQDEDDHAGAARPLDDEEDLFEGSRHVRQVVVGLLKQMTQQLRSVYLSVFVSIIVIVSMHPDEVLSFELAADLPVLQSLKDLLHQQLMVVHSVMRTSLFWRFLQHLWVSMLLATEDLVLDQAGFRRLTRGEVSLVRGILVATEEVLLGSANEEVNARVERLCGIAHMDVLMDHALLPYNTLGLKLQNKIQKLALMTSHVEEEDSEGGHRSIFDTEDLRAHDPFVRMFWCDASGLEMLRLMRQWKQDGREAARVIDVFMKLAEQHALQAAFGLSGQEQQISTCVCHLDAPFPARGTVYLTTYHLCFTNIFSAPPPDATIVLHLNDIVHADSLFFRNSDALKVTLKSKNSFQLYGFPPGQRNQLVALLVQQTGRDVTSDQGFDVSFLMRDLALTLPAGQLAERSFPLVLHGRLGSRRKGNLYLCTSVVVFECDSKLELELAYPFIAQVLVQAVGRAWGVALVHNRGQSLFSGLETEEDAWKVLDAIEEKRNE